MDWEVRLTTLYVYICEQYRNHLWIHCQRMSNNANPEFTDEEVITIYLWGIMQHRRDIKDIYNYTNNHLKEWFPHLPSYAGYIQRINQLNSVFPALAEQIQADSPRLGVLKNIYLIDSMPIVMAKEKRSSKAKVANHFANKGYNASKGFYYHGVKIHILGSRRPGTLPFPEYIELTPASDHDLMVLRAISPYLNEGELYSDKAYIDEMLKQILQKEQNMSLQTPVKKAKGQKRLPMFEQLFSTSVSRVRQPIESLFNWIEEKTGIQVASKVRSFNGLMVHVFGRLAAAMFMLVFNS